MMGAFALYYFLKTLKMAKQQAVSQRISKSKKRGKHSKSASCQQGE
jgi:hypothetical protein